MTKAAVSIGAAGGRNTVYELLRNGILSMNIKPGEMLSENTLSAQFSVGRVRVRDALAQLAEEGYIVVYPQRGTEVTMIDIGRLRQAVNAHVVLEQAVIRELCSRKLTKKQGMKLTEVLQFQKGKGIKDNPLELLGAERQFAYLLASFCGREHIWKIYRTLDCDLLRVSYLRYSTFNYQMFMHSLNSWENTQVEERLLLDNIRRGEAEAAALICSNHFNTILQDADSLRRIHPQYFAG